MKVFKTLSLVILSVLLASPVGAGSLQQTLVDAYNNKGVLTQNRALLRAADEDVAVAAAALKPVLSWSSNLQRQFGSRNSAPLNNTSGISTNSANLDVTAALTVYDGGQNKLAINAAKEAVLSTRQSLILVEQQVLFSAIEAFVKVRRDIEIVGLRKNNMRVIKEELRAAQDRFEVGEITKTDVAFAEARLAASTSALAAAQANLVQAKESYKQSVGAAPGKLSAPNKAPNLPRKASEVKAKALRAHPELIALQHDIKQAELNVLRAEAGTGMTVKLSGSLGYSDSEGDNFSNSNSFGVSASGPIYSGGRLSALVRQAKARRDAQRAGLYVTKAKIEQQAGSAFALLQMARASRAATDEQIRAAVVAFEGVREEAAVGARTTLDVLNAEQELLDAKADRVTSLTDEVIAGYRVLMRMGQLTAESLNLPVQRFDPAEYYNLVKSAPTKRSAWGSKLDRVLKALSP
ncbi:TolC family outer membrane protein [Rhodobacteraceae bacterium]|nr:TolC family outer membrane protein [Paracoccaceae bacterium]